jgi:hypothetical protein
LSKLRYILIILMASLAFSSCEKVIEIDLADSKSIIVIEATINNNREPFTVLVSKTSPYFGASSSNLVSGAVVSVRVENGKPKYFKESSPGVYKLDKTLALANYWYIVDVQYEGVTYSARSYLNETVPIAEISLSYFDGFGFFDSGYKVNCFIRDPAGIKNYYRMKIYVNGQLSANDGEINLYSDELFDGKLIGLIQHSAVFKETDALIVEMQSIDKATYDYFSTLASISGIEIIQSASPANPISNFNNGALGYFSAYSFVRQPIVVKDYINK